MRLETWFMRLGMGMGIMFDTSDHVGREGGVTGVLRVSVFVGNTPAQNMQSPHPAKRIAKYGTHATGICSRCPPCAGAKLRRRLQPRSLIA